GPPSSQAPPPPYAPFGGGPGWGAAPSPQKDPVDSKARLALGLAIPGLVLCCGPLGIAGMLLGLQASSMAKRSQVPTPTKAVAATVLGSLSLLLFIGAMISGIREQRARQARLAETSGALAGTLDKPRLDPKAACLLAETELLRGLYRKNDRVKDV